MSGTLFLLPVPLGGADPADVLAPSALRVARQVTYVLAENARSARAFLKAAGHPRPIQEIRIVQIGHEPRRDDALAWLAPVQAGSDAAVVSECGCPGVADPGAVIVACAHELGVPVQPLVGPSSILLALMASGMNGQRFRFLGYLPQDGAALVTQLRRLERDAHGETQVFIETPYRTERLFESIVAHCAGSLQLCLALDLAEPDQTVVTRSVDAWRALPRAQRPPMQRRPAVFLLYADSGVSARQ